MKLTSKELFTAMKKTAEEINEVDSFYGKLALRKVNALNENTPIETLLKYGKDLELIASKLS